MAEPEPSLVIPYYSRRQVELAAALLLRDLGLQGAFEALAEGEAMGEGPPERGAGPGVVELCNSTQSTTQAVQEISHSPNLPASGSSEYSVSEEDEAATRGRQEVATRGRQEAA
jgi:hypothetical protein